MDKSEVGKRLKKFLIDKYGKLTIGSAALGLLPQSLQKYTTGKSLPGAELIATLKSVGCDTDWLLLIKDEPSNSRNGAKATPSSYERNTYLPEETRFLIEDKSGRIKVGKRLEEFAMKRIGGLKVLADALEMDTRILQQYLSGRSIPGAELIVKLYLLGCDIEWLLLMKDGPDSKDKDRVIFGQAQKILELEEELKKIRENSTNKNNKNIGS